MYYRKSKKNWKSKLSHFKNRAFVITFIAVIVVVLDGAAGVVVFVILTNGKLQGQRSLAFLNHLLDKLVNAVMPVWRPSIKALSFVLQSLSDKQFNTNLQFSLCSTAANRKYHRQRNVYFA